MFVLQMLIDRRYVRREAGGTVEQRQRSDVFSEISVGLKAGCVDQQKSRRDHHPCKSHSYTSNAHSALATLELL